MASDEEFKDIDIREMLRDIQPSKKPMRRQRNLIDYNVIRDVDRKYTQDWPAYDQAKTNEDRLFKKMLEELLFLAIEENPTPKRGRKAYSLRDKIFCMCIKAFYRSSLRKGQSILKELQRLHYINKVPCFKTIDNFFNDETLSTILDNLILISALPLAPLEETGAVDATGFSLKAYERWSDFKYGKEEGKLRLWRKAHAMAGCKTNIIIGVEVTGGHVNDVTMFEKVVSKRVQYFTNMRDIVADKAYTCRPVFNVASKLGLTPIMKFKSNHTSKSRGCMLWFQMMYYWWNHAEEALERYHKRSNVETSFHMLKQRLGRRLYTKNMTANINEIKIMCLCHNLCILIQETFESDINVDFAECVKKVGCV